MSKFGSGFGKDTILLHYRPCRTNNSAANQKIRNKRFQRDFETGEIFNDQRPQWWNTIPEPIRPPSPSRLGEWKLVWMPKDKVDGEEEYLPTNGRQGEAAKSRGAEPSLPRERTAAVSQRGAEKGSILPPISPNKAELEVLPSTSRSKLSTARQKDNGTGTQRSHRSRKSLGTRASQRSTSTLSDYSGVTVEDEQIISRIRGLEDALKAEKMLREKMQSLLATKGLGVNLEYPAADRPRDF